MKRFPKWLSLLMVVALVVPLLLVPSGAAPTVGAQIGEIKTASSTSSAKVSPQLKAAVAAAASADYIDLVVYADKDADLGRYMDRIVSHKYVMPTGTKTFVGRARADRVEKIASLPNVAAVKLMKFEGDVPQPLEGMAGAPDIAALRAQLAALKAARPAGAAVKPAGAVSPAGWFDVLDIHKSKAAWDLGFDGEGVKVMVNDSGIDFAHPDLQGTQARINDPASPYNGWPIVFDSASMLSLAYDYLMGTTFIMDGMGIVGVAPDYAYTGYVRQDGDLVDNGDGTYSAIFAPIGSTDPGGHVYTFTHTSKSGVYHFGSHPDTALAALLGERAAVLVVDETHRGRLRHRLRRYRRRL